MKTPEELHKQIHELLTEEELKELYYKLNSRIKVPASERAKWIFVPSEDKRYDLFDEWAELEPYPFDSKVTVILQNSALIPVKDIQDALSWAKAKFGVTPLLKKTADYFNSLATAPISREDFSHVAKYTCSRYMKECSICLVDTCPKLKGEC